MIKHFQAAYIVDSIAKVINDFRETLSPDTKPINQEKLNKINGLLQHVSSFEVAFPYTHDLDFQHLSPVLATLNNIITRGLPTRAPLNIEKVFTDIDLIEPNKETYEFYFPYLKGENEEIAKLKMQDRFKTIFELLHIIEPNLYISKENYGSDLSGTGEWEFLNNRLSNYPFAKQIFQSQRDFSTINIEVGGGRRVDFSFEFPYFNIQGNFLGKKGVILEYDGKHHQEHTYKYYDAYRDAAAKDENFETLRQIASESNLTSAIVNQLNNDIFTIFEKNFNRNFSDYLDYYTLIFTPLAVARIQKTLIEYFLVHPEIFKKTEISIAIIERDLPCAALAIKGLEKMFEHINAILEEKDWLLLPKINLSIFETKKWVYKSELHLGITPKQASDFNENDFDIILDHSILRRSNTYKENDFKADKAIKIRSAHYTDTSFGNSRRVYCANLLAYKTLVNKEPDGSYTAIPALESHINFFIQEIFRKKEYREGQLPIISRALQQQPVIGLLPTGGGKSLTFQLPSFLQPGLCLIVDPIKSLMEDQVRVLRENWIDCCEYINSNLEREHKKRRLVNFRYGETLFMFVSPERFVMEEFRTIISNINSNFGLAFSYCVIDEVHCVSEWGHDFRSTYLMLGKNAQDFAKTHDKKPVSLIGLTATASFDVLADIERELKIARGDVANAIIMIENTIRPELFFRVIDVTGQNRIDALNADFWEMGRNLSVLNDKEVLKKSLEHHFEEFDVYNKDILKDENKKAIISDEQINSFLLKEELAPKTQNDFFSIVFCPVRGQKINSKGEFSNQQGVMYVHENIKSNSKGYFYSADNDNVQKEVIQYFKEFTTNKLKHIVCTKAFGMGIDKKDVRTTYHHYYSSSLESLVQEAGRSGRDKKISQANILVSSEEKYRLLQDCLYRQNPKDENINLNIFDNVANRKKIRKLISSKDGFSSEEDLLAKIDATLSEFRGLEIEEKEELKIQLKAFIEPFHTDRSIHYFFSDRTFKGVNTEIGQFYSLFKDKEFLYSSKLQEIETEFNENNATNYQFTYWKRGIVKRIYVEENEEFNIGFIDVSRPINTYLFNPLLNQIREFILEKNGGEADISNLLNSETTDYNINEGTLEEVFELPEKQVFSFYLSFTKIYSRNFDDIFSKIKLVGGQANIMANYLNVINGHLATGFYIVGEFGNIGNRSKCFFFNWFYLNEIFEKDYIEQIETAVSKQLGSQMILEIIYRIQIERCMKKANNNFVTFLLLLEEYITALRFNFDENSDVIKDLKYFFYRNRESSNDTGRLIYRMHSMGLIKDYEIDYNEKLYKCTFVKYDSIDEYVEHIERYLRRYLSEQTALEKIKDLKMRLVKESLVDNILECLYFLGEFSYKEIATKRKRATDEIEKMLNKCITNLDYKTDWYKQNLFIKEEIYFYFNAKYARPDFEIENESYSLLADYESNRKKEANSLSKKDILSRYLDVLKKEGTEQNNYKHLIGSCKKIMRSLAETDLEQEWLLRLLKAFALYGVNNPSYVKEATEEIEWGFTNLYNNEEYKHDFTKISIIFESYFKKLSQSITEDNISFEIIKVIRLKLLQDLQASQIKEIIKLILI